MFLVDGRRFLSGVDNMLRGVFVQYTTPTTISNDISERFSPTYNSSDGSTCTHCNQCHPWAYNLYFLDPSRGNLCRCGNNYPIVWSARSILHTVVHGRVVHESDTTCISVDASHLRSAYHYTNCSSELSVDQSGTSLRRSKFLSRPHQNTSSRLDQL
jgi:hypothetical protein